MPGGTSRSEDLARLLAERVAAGEGSLEGEVSVAELRRRLIPYEVARADLALATKAEYDLALLELLGGEEHLEADDRELVRAARRELESPEPGLAFLQDYAASHLTLRLAGLAGGGEEAASEGGDGGGPDDEPPGSDAGTWAPAADSPGDGCWSCGEELPGGVPDAAYCVWCGADLSIRPCRECGEELELEWAYCPRCGAGAES